MKQEQALTLGARHLWDDYSWNLQESPFDIDMGWDGVFLGSSSSAFEDLALVVAFGELEKQPRHMQVFLRALAFESEFDLSDSDEVAPLEAIWLDGIAKLVVEQVNEPASQRSLDQIGPYRGDCFQSASGNGVVWSLLDDRGDAWDIVTDHVDELVDPDSDPLHRATAQCQLGLIERRLMRHTRAAPRSGPAAKPPDLE